MKCRKLLAILLALVMVIGLLPFAALAEEVPGSSPGDEVSDKIVADQNDPLPEGDPLGTDPEGEPQDEPLPEGDPLWEQPPEVSLLNDEHHAGATVLKSTHSALSDGSYYLSGNVELNQPVTFTGTATLCLNGYTLSCNSNMVITVNGTLTICDCAGGGRIEATNKNALYAIDVGRSKTLYVEGGTICGGSRGISGSSNSKINISGGTIQKSASSTYKALELTGTTATITGGTITGGVELKSSSKLSLGGTPTVDTIKLTHKSCSINATAANEAYSGEPITIDYGNLDYSDGTAIVSGVTAENAESFIVTPPDDMEVELDENGNLVFGEPSSNPGHSHEDDVSVNWQALNADRESWNLSDGCYYLSENLELGISQQIKIQGNVTLCLNGRTLKSAAAYNTGAIKVETGATLTICDCGTGGTITCSYTSQKPVIFIKGTCNLEKGTISLTNSTLGYAILVDTRASFTMSGGTLIGGKTGIYNRGTASISGGSITGMESGIETATNPAVFHISGGTFTGEGADSSGILITNGSLNMTGGTAIGKEAGVNLRTTSTNNPEDISLAISGGTMQGSYGIYHQSDYPLYLTGEPELSTLYLASTKNEVFVSNDDGGVYSGDRVAVSLGSGESENAIVIKGVQGNADKFTYAGEDFELAADDEGNLILQAPTTAPGHQNHGADGTGTITENWQVWDPKTTPTISTVGYYYLDADYGFINSTITIDADVHLCLNGHLLKDNQNKSDFIVIKDGASLTICDCDEEGAGVLDYFTSGESGYAINNYGDLTLYSGKINSMRAGGVWMPASATGTFIMAGGTIDVGGTAINNGGSASEVLVNGGNVLYGGSNGIFAAGNGTTNISGGTIQPREGNTTGGGFYGGQYASTILISGGTIVGNQYGVSIPQMYGTGTASYTISGGTITAENGYGVRIDSGETVALIGTPEITGTDADLFIKNPNVVKVTKDGASYTGEELRVSFGGSENETEPIVLDVTTQNAGKFQLTAPEGKILVSDGNNLVLGNEAAGHQNHGINGSGEGEGTWTAWNPQTTKTLDDGYYYLDKNYDDLKAITVTGDAHLCLNGHEMSDNGRDAEFIIVNSGASLTICDCSEGETGRINYNCKTGYAINNKGALTLYSGKIYSDGGNGILIMSNGGSDVKFDMEGGTIDVGRIGILFSIGNKVNIEDGTLIYGGQTGVLFGAEGTLTVSGGTIQPREKGASDSQGISKTDAGDLYVTDGNISGKQNGIRITNPEGGKVEISGGNISASGGEGYGIYLSKSATADLYLSKDPEISGKKAALYIGKPNAVYASSENGQAAYRGDDLTVAFTGNDTEAPIILDVNDYNDGKFNLVSPKDKTLVRQDDNLVLGEKTVEVPELVLSSLPETVTYGETFTLTATGGGEGALTWAATGAADVDQYGNVTITGAGSFTITATKGGKEATATGTAVPKAITITAEDQHLEYGDTIEKDVQQVAVTTLVTGDTLDSIVLTAGDTDITPSNAVIKKGDTDVSDYYTITYVPGSLTFYNVPQEGFAITGKPATVTYGDTFKLTATGGNTTGTVTWTAEGAAKVDQEGNVTITGTGDFTIKATKAGDDTFAAATATYQGKAQKRALTVTADDIWVYAGDTPKFTATITGYVNGEDWQVLKGKLTFTCDYSEKYSKPGSRHIITPDGLTADNYDISFETGTLTVKDPLSPRFNVYVLDSKHGTVEADCRYARKGDVVTLTIKPDWGYELETLTVTDSHGYELKLTYHSNGTYTFTMPRDNVTVKAIFTVRDMPFVDVPGDAWYAGGVRYVYAHGLMNGTGNWRFSPNRTTTRAMIATILYRMEGSPRVYGTSQFGDVEAGSWYEDAVIWATQNDIVEGYTSKTFGPNDPITREQMAAMLYRYADYCRCDMSAGRYVDLSKFSDMDKVSDYAIPALRWAVGEEIIQGRTGKRLAPTDTATRAEVAVMLMRFCEDVIW